MNELNEENNFGTPVLDDIDYSAPNPKKDAPMGVSAPVLDDIDYSAPSAKKSGPTGVAAPVLDDMDTYVPSGSKKGAPSNVTAPVLDDNDYSYSAPKQEYAPPEQPLLSDWEIIQGLSDEQRKMFYELPEEKKQQVLDMRRAQLEQQAAEPIKPPVLDDENSYVPPPKNETAPAAPITAPVLDDENSYVPPPKKENTAPSAPITKPILDDEPAPTKYVPKFADEDLERTKAEARKKAVSSQLVSNQKDEKESLRMMLELKAEREAEAAHKGFFMLIGVAIVGVVAAVMFYLLYSGGLSGVTYNDDGNKFFAFLESYSIVLAALGGLLSLSLITGIGGLKSLCSFYHLVFALIQLIGVFTIMPQLEGSGIKWVFCICALVGAAAVLVVPSASENIGYFYKKSKN